MRNLRESTEGKGIRPAEHNGTVPKLEVDTVSPDTPQNALIHLRSDVLTCPCSGRMKLFALFTDPRSVAHALRDPQRVYLSGH